MAIPLASSRSAQQAEPARLRHACRKRRVEDGAWWFGLARCGSQVSRRRPSHGEGRRWQVKKEIWRATDEQVRRILAQEGIELIEEEFQALLDQLSLYLDVALEECVQALGRQQLEGRKRENGKRPGGAGG